MEIHRFEKIWAVVSVALIVAFIVTITYGAVGAGIKMVDDSGGTVDPQNLGSTEFSDPGVRCSGGECDVYVIAQQFLFQPGTSQPIEVPADTPVTFHITSSDVVHGFNIVGTNVNTMVIPGQVATITVEFDDPGEYGVVCHEYCGAGHHNMEGKVVVVEQSEFQGESQ